MRVLSNLLSLFMIVMVVWFGLAVIATIIDAITGNLKPETFSGESDAGSGGTGPPL
ncbi:hypothetical protein J2S30_002201 [Herbaspirillum rubrisubalbicans]|uniref:hypothetical protein n=1 Tax=Herbaspirillum rubrisubalbicans TaxID=80842 RepID=UPI00209F36C5|nr:hypothetical protein [Herbaspirillum rubrisubalbicans]MCP1573822.1 hypothetical protein [Herbaspirillum rubrisubalbicans]